MPPSRGDGESVRSVESGRRGFLVAGALGGALLALGGNSCGKSRSPHGREGPAPPFQVFSPAEASVLLAIADRLIPPRAGFPSPRQLELGRKMDAVAAMADPATQSDLRRLVRLFESALVAFVLDGHPRRFTHASPEQQDARLTAWATSRIAVRRTGYRAAKRLVYASYYACPETWPAIGYPGPPFRVDPPRSVEAPPR